MRSLVAAARNAIVESPIRYVSTNLTIPSRAPQGSATENIESYAEIGTFHAIVNRLATGVAQVDWKLWRSAKSGKEMDRTEVTMHAALDLLDNPTPFHSRAETMEAVQQHNDITGLGYLVLGRATKTGPPINMYFIRPDRMAPIPHPKQYLEGYVYFGPDGEKVFLGVDEVLQLRCPDPRDPFGGIAPIQSVMTEAQSYKYAQQWNRNFFLNDASPGGIIQLDKRLSDPDFFKLRDRWRQSHQGVGNAHRVGILEQGTWIERAFNQRDMQFVEMSGISGKAIREAYGFPKFALGDVEDVNRASAEASDVMLARWLITPRLERWRGMLNNRLLPLFGATGVGLEFDFENPVPPDQAADDVSLETRTRVFVALVGAGVSAEDAASVASLPEMVWTAPALPAAPSAPPPFGRSSTHIHAESDLTAEEQARLHALETVQQDWRTILDRLMGQWGGIGARTRENIYVQIGAAVAAGDPAALADMQVSDEVIGEGQALLAAAMAELAVVASQRVVEEAAAQGVNIAPVGLDGDEIGTWAKTVALLLAGRLLLSAGREAIRRMTTNSTPQEVVQGVREHLEGLSDRDEQDHLGGALTNAQNSARIATMRAGPQAEYYADETLDENTCLAPDVLVTTGRGRVYAKDVNLDDRLLTHVGRWVRPSAITVSEVEEELVHVTVPGRTLRLTWDHPVLAATESGFVWRDAGDLTAGDFVVDESSLHLGGEPGQVDVDLGQTPHDVAAVDQIGGLATINLGPERMPVGAIRFDDQPIADQEVNDPRADLSLCTVHVAEPAERSPDGPFDAGLGVAGRVTTPATEPFLRSGGRYDPDAAAALLAVDGDRGTATSLGTVRPCLGLAVSEHGAASATQGGAATGRKAARAGAVGIPGLDRERDVEADVAVRAELRYPTAFGSEFGAEIRVSEFALCRAVDGAGPVGGRDRRAAHLAVNRRLVGTSSSPPRFGGTGPAQSLPPGIRSALRTRYVHDIILVQVERVERVAYRGKVYDFTVPEDGTFFADGVLVHNCPFCAAVDGRWLGETLAEVERMYPNGGYVDCAGRERCRGTVRAVWRPETTG